MSRNYRLIKIYFKIGNEILYLTVESIENDKWLKKVLNLNNHKNNYHKIYDRTKCANKTQ